MCDNLYVISWPIYSLNWGDCGILKFIDSENWEVLDNFMEQIGNFVK
jgi:hypothetical protein